MRITRGALVAILVCGGAVLAVAQPELGGSTADLVEAAKKDRVSSDKQGEAQDGTRQSNMRFALSEIKRTAPSKIRRSDLFDPKAWSSSFSLSADDIWEPAKRAAQVRVQAQSQGRGPMPAQINAPNQIRRDEPNHNQGQILPQSPPEPPAPSYTFVGRMIDRNEVSLFLIRNDRPYVVKVNDVLDNSYRVDKITGVDVTLTYLPSNTQQILTFNSTAVGSSALIGSTFAADPAPSATLVAPQPPDGAFAAAQKPIPTVVLPEGDPSLPGVRVTAPQ